jgi:hypothetical protein
MKNGAEAATGEPGAATKLAPEHPPALAVREAKHAIVNATIAVNATFPTRPLARHGIRAEKKFFMSDLLFSVALDDV